jgi:hypothetical protein
MRSTTLIMHTLENRPPRMLAAGRHLLFGRYRNLIAFCLILAGVPPAGAQNFTRVVDPGNPITTDQNESGGGTCSCRTGIYQIATTHFT